MRRVLILYTGGTFGMGASRQQGMTTLALKPAELARRLHERVPELREIARCDTQIVLNCDSAHVGPEHWLLIAQKIQAARRRYDGVVVLHGTDTMAYTASALSFLLRPCPLPVILTGAQRPLAALRTDARRNLISAVEIAAHGPRDRVSRVCVFFDDKLFQGNRVRKRSASEFEAFESPQAPELAIVGTEIRYQPKLKCKTDASRLLPAFSGGVLMAHVTPGFVSRAMREQLLPKLRGLVLVVFASGTAPTHDPEFVELLKDAKRRRVPVVVTTEGATQGGGSGASPHHYAAGRELLKQGGVWAGSMTPECAYVKTAWILAQPGAEQRFAALWRKDYAGEA